MSIRVADAGELLAITPDALRRIVQVDAELSDILMRAFILRRASLIASGQGDIVLVGSRHSAATLRVREFLIRNGQPHTYLDADSDPGVQALLDRFAFQTSDVPVVICHSDRVLKNPTNAEIAEFLGFNHSLDLAAVRDVVIVGAGPAGLAAAVYGSSEGLDVLVLENNAPEATPFKALDSGSLAPQIALEPSFVEYASGRDTALEAVFTALSGGAEG